MKTWTSRAFCSPNDGMVTVDSAKWGTFMGWIPADHLGVVGQPKQGRHPFTGFDHVEFYRKMASSLDDQIAAHVRAAGSP